jgi:hypothetical protein
MASTLAPARTLGHVAAWTGVGSPKADSNQARVDAEKPASGSMPDMMAPGSDMGAPAPAGRSRGSMGGCA